MADTKITALTAITTVDPAADVLPIVDVSDTSMAASGTTKKITSNQILGAGGTATLASATITGDLSVGGNGAFTGTGYLALQRALNPVGENGATSLDFRWYSTGTTYTTGARVHSSSDAAWTASSTPARLMFSTVPSGSTSLSERYRIDNTGIHTWSNVGGVAGTAMTLNSTGLGVGGSPSFKLDVQGSGATIARLKGGSGSNQGSAYFVTRAGSASSLLAIGDYATIGGGTPDQAASIYTDVSIPLRFDIGGSEKARIDSSGNVGIGVTPSYLFHTAVASGANRNIARFQVTGASNGLTITWDHATTKMIVNFSNLPTSSAGLASGDLWIDTAAGNTLKVA